VVSSQTTNDGRYAYGRKRRSCLSDIQAAIGQHGDEVADDSIDRRDDEKDGSSD
jgi:hypothetical protein